MALTDMLSVAEFYGQDVWGTPWGPNHRGFDVERAASRPVPHLFPGTVVRRGRNSELGGFVVVDRGAGLRGRYIGYGHTVGGTGNALGHVADYDEDHGSKWSAPHTHLGISDSPYGIDTPGVATYDPLPFIIDAISGAAGGGAVLFPESPEEDEMLAEFYVATSNNKTVTVGAGDIWVRSEPGAELRRLTQGQATEYFAKYGLDFSSPSVHGREGSWFDDAFAEDAIVHGYNVASHPYLAASSGQVALDAAAIANLTTSLKGALPKAPTLAEITSAFATANDADVTALSAQITALGKSLPEAVRKDLVAALSS